ncbi:ATPase [Sulfurifustis variabilis]|uniref:Uncharacterized AAA domain-containing protein ycf46 n=1 Tax=Sulfurifustis variabilis TaxID=1675686 RepID=A0A1B4VCY3_9GAMM|nr:AAA family ATPase [Sulfurifustis variabilis]BAU47057.1 ATPase [Sulfurifustis variabilis]
MNDQRDLEVILRSRFPIVVVETHEETRLLGLLERIARLDQSALFAWSVADGLRRRDKTLGGPVPMTNEPTAVLRHVAATPQNGIYVLLDFHPYLSDPVNVRLLKEIALGYEKTARTVVLVSHELSPPPELQRHVARFLLSIPDQAAIRAMISEEIQLWRATHGGGALKGDREAVELMVQHLSGMFAEDARRLIRQAIHDDHALDRADLDRIVRAKHELLGREGVLSFERDTSTFDEVAGLANLKRWLGQRRAAFVGDGKAVGLEAPKGVLLIGVQGCGKSLAAKAVAGSWGVPLLRLDFGALYDRWLGQTERNLRESLRVADAMAPCVLWTDELEKGIAADGPESDGGVSKRTLGALLTWMAERKARVFLVATANDIGALPPELVRKGRFDEIFFVDLPGADARAEILRIHLRRRAQDPGRFDLPELVAACDGFSGAEIEQAVVAALYEARAEDRALGTAHVLDEMRRTRPLSQVMGEKIEALRRWAAERTVRAD